MSQIELLELFEFVASEYNLETETTCSLFSVPFSINNIEIKRLHKNEWVVYIPGVIRVRKIPSKKQAKRMIRRMRILELFFR